MTDSGAFSAFVASGAAITAGAFAHYGAFYVAGGFAATSAVSRMGATEKTLDRHASTLKRFFEEDSHNALSDRVARLEAAVEATALAWGTSE